MSRMLKALQQIESSSPRPCTEPVPPAHPQTPQATAQLAEEAPAIEEETGGSQWPILPAQEHRQAYGELADGILSQFPPGCGAALMFTSPADGDGKTGTLVPLAAVLAERSSDEVLIIDANLRNPGVAERLGVQPRCGLLDVLLGTTNWHQAVRRTVVRGLSVLPGLRFSALGGQPLRDMNFGPLLEELSRQYGLILIDTSSLAHEEVAPIAMYCDGVYLVVRLDRTTRRAAREAVTIVHDCQGRVLGSVVVGG